MGRGQTTIHDQFDRALGFRRGSDRPDEPASNTVFFNLSTLILDDEEGKYPQYVFQLLEPSNPDNFSPSKNAVVVMHLGDDEVENGEFSWWRSRLLFENDHLDDQDATMLGGHSLSNTQVRTLHNWLEAIDAKYPDYDDSKR